MQNPDQYAFGSFVIFDDQSIKPMVAESIKIEGVQHSLLTNFEMTQTFKHSEPSPKDIRYFFANDLKMCIYDLTFVIGEEIIKPELKPKEAAKDTYDEAVEEGHTAVYGSNFVNGLTEIQLGNILPNVECKIIFKMAFTANLIDEKQFFIKFPLGVYTPDGEITCLTAKNFQFKLVGEKDHLSNITSNIHNGHTDLQSMTFSINKNAEGLDDQHSIIISFTSKEPIENRCLTTSNGSYSCCSLILFPHLPSNETISLEFVFLVDCSGSMFGQSIQKAGECLEFFIKSLPVDCYFNIIRFGSNFEPLFTSSERYSQTNVEKAVYLAQNLTDDLGGTEIYAPLQHIFNAENQFGQRQVFILTDGEVWNPDKVIQLVKEHSTANRCFTVGLGRGCDAGLVEGIANSSGGKCAFVQEGDSISQKIIPQLQSSLQQSLNSLEVHIEGDDSFEISPYPIPPVNPNGSIQLLIRTRKDPSIFDNGILITGCLNQENIEIPVTTIEPLVNVEEDRYGCSDGRNIGSCILPLFAFYSLKSLENNRNFGVDEKMKSIELSISSGVLCKFTGYVGVSRCHIATPLIKPRPIDFDAIFEQMKQSSKIAAAIMRACGQRGSCFRDSPTEPDNEHRSSVSPFTGLPNFYASSFPKDSTNECCQQPIESNDNLLLSIMRCQNIDGSWSDLQKIRQITGISYDSFDDIAVSDPNKKEQCIATIIAIVALRAKAANEKDTWVLLEAKALSWLHQTLPTVEIECIINRIIPKI